MSRTCNRMHESAAADFGGVAHDHKRSAAIDVGIEKGDEFFPAYPERTRLDPAGEGEGAQFGNLSGGECGPAGGIVRRCSGPIESVGGPGVEAVVGDAVDGKLGVAKV